jgi:hypothetical protein
MTEPLALPDPFPAQCPWYSLAEVGVHLAEGGLDERLVEDLVNETFQSLTGGGKREEETNRGSNRRGGGG